MLCVPSSGPSLPARRRMRLLALIQVRDEARYLPGWIANVIPHVDGVVALDDGSSDGSGELLEARPEVLELMRVPPGRPAWDELGNYRRLVAAGLRHGAEWLLSLDADERLERDFRDRAERVIRRGSLLGLTAYSLRLYDLWERPDRFRSDGIWGGKRVARLFRARADHAFDERPLHARKIPRQGHALGRVPAADLRLYHLRMLRPEDRLERGRRYERLDPDGLYQPDEGYAYLTDESGLRLRRLRPARGYVE